LVGKGNLNQRVLEIIRVPTTMTKGKMVEVETLIKGATNDRIRTTIGGINKFNNIKKFISVKRYIY